MLRIRQFAQGLTTLGFGYSDVLTLLHRKQHVNFLTPFEHLLDFVLSNQLVV